MCRLVAFALCLAALSAATGASGAGRAGVTLRVHAPFDPGIAARNIRFSGRVSSGRAGEVVEVQARECARHSFYRLIAGTRTLRGGSWAIDNEVGGVDVFEVPLQASFRARWRGKFSNVVTVGAPLPLFATWNAESRTARVSVSAGTTGYGFAGRFVELQRDAGGGQWVRVRRARLSRSRDGSFVAVFRVSTRGLTPRVFASHATGAPCFTTAASDTWRS